MKLLPAQETVCTWGPTDQLRIIKALLSLEFCQKLLSAYIITAFKLNSTASSALEPLPALLPEHGSYLQSMRDPVTWTPYGVHVAQA